MNTLFVLRNEQGKYFKGAAHTTHTGTHVIIEFTDKLKDATISPDIRTFQRKADINLSTLERVEVTQQTLRVLATPSSVAMLDEARGSKGAVAALMAILQDFHDHPQDASAVDVIAAVNDAKKLLEDLKIQLCNLVDIRGDGQSMEPKISGEIYSDDRVHAVDFNAAQWFSQAGEWEILNLVAEGCACSDTADTVGQYFEPKIPAISALFTYVSDMQVHGGKNPIGYSVTMDQDQVMAWLFKHRQDVALKCWISSMGHIDVYPPVDGDKDAKWYCAINDVKEPLGFDTEVDAIRAMWLKLRK